MRRLFAADRVRFGHRRDLWILVALVPIILGVMFVSEFNAVTTPPQSSFFMDPPDPVLEAEMRAQELEAWRGQLATALPAFAFPASLLKVAGNFGPIVLLAIYLSTALVAGEFEWGTVRTVHLTASRGRTLAVRVGVVVGLIGVVMALTLVLGSVLPFLLSFEGTPLQGYAAPVPDLASGLVIRATVVLPFIALPVLLAIVTRSIALAFLLLILVVALDGAITGAPIWAASPASFVPAFTIFGSISRLLGGAMAQLAPQVPAELSYGALIAWSVVPILAAIALFRRMDLNE